MDKPSNRSRAFDRRGRRVIRVDDFTEEEISLIVQTEAPTEDFRLDAELKGSKASSVEEP